jgi:hypothetical protein
MVKTKQKARNTGNIGFQWINILSLILSFIASISIIISYLSLILNKLLHIFDGLSINHYPYLMPTTVGGLSALIGLAGAFIGFGIQNLLKLRVNNIMGQRVHWFFSGMFWVFGISFSILFMSEDPNIKAESGHIFSTMLLCSIMGGIIIGLIAPLLDKKYYGDVGAGFPGDSNIRGCVEWFTRLGVVFALCCSLAVVLSNPKSTSISKAIVFILLSIILYIIYGLIIGLATFRIGGLGRLTLKRGIEGLVGSMFGILIGVISVIVTLSIFPRIRTFNMAWNLILIGLSAGAIIGTYYPKSLKSSMELMVIGPDSEDYRDLISSMMKAVYMAAIAIPLGMIVSLSAILSGFLN